MGDNDASHYVEGRLNDLDTRVSRLEREGRSDEAEPKTEEETQPTEEDPIAAFSATTTRGRRGSKEGTE